MYLTRTAQDNTYLSEKAFEQPYSQSQYLNQPLLRRDAANPTIFDDDLDEYGKEIVHSVSTKAKDVRSSIAGRYSHTPTFASERGPSSFTAAKVFKAFSRWPFAFSN